MTRESHLHQSSARVQVGQVWRRDDGSRVRVQGFSKIDRGWVMVREIGGDRARGSYPPTPFENGGFTLVCPECGGDVKDAADGPYRACVACGHVTDSDPGFS